MPRRMTCPERPERLCAGWRDKLAHLPAVEHRVRALTAAAAQNTLVDTRSRMVALQRVVEADPTEIVSIIGNACRHCHGIDHEFHWRDANELCRALDRHLASLATPDPLPRPSAHGGFGYRGDVPPHDDCPQCLGDGVTHVRLTPSDELSPNARALLKGIRAKPDGTIEVSFHDKLAASDQLNRMAGVYVEKRVNLNVDVSPLAPDMSQADMLALIDSVRPSNTP